MLIEKRFSNIEVLLSRSASMFRVGGKAHLIFIQSGIVLCFCFQELGNDNGSEVTHDAKNLYASEDHLIYFFSDAPHSVKTVRNALSNSGSGKGTRYEFEYHILVRIIIDCLASLTKKFFINWSFLLFCRKTVTYLKLQILSWIEFWQK